MSRTVADLLVGVLERLEPAFHRTRPQRPRPYWLGDTFEVLGSEVLQLEQIADQFSVCSRRSLSSWSAPTAHLTNLTDVPTLRILRIFVGWFEGGIVNPKPYARVMLSVGLGARSHLASQAHEDDAERAVRGHSNRLLRSIGYADFDRGH
jgi:hypothetical protein